MTLNGLLNKLRQGDVVEFDAHSPMALPVLARCYEEFPDLMHWYDLHGMNALSSFYMQVPTARH